MASKILKFGGDNVDDAPIFIEIEDENQGTLTRSKGVSDKIEKVADSFEQSVRPLKKISQAVISQVNDSAREVTVELGLKFNAAANMVISKVGTEAHLKVTIKWSKKISESIKTNNTTEMERN